MLPIPHGTHRFRGESEHWSGSASLWRLTEVLPSIPFRERTAFQAGLVAGLVDQPICGVTYSTAKAVFGTTSKPQPIGGVNIQGGMIRFCPEYSIKSTLKLAVSPNSPLVIHPIIYLVDSLLAKPTYIHKLFFLHRYRLVRYVDISLYL